MQHQKLRSRAWYNSVGTPPIVAELDENRCAIERFHDGPDLAARQSLGRQIRQQCNGIEQRKLIA